MSSNIDSQDDFSSSMPTFLDSSLSHDDPSFLEPRMEIFAEAGLLGATAAKNIPDLLEVWMNERNAPELLPYERALVEPLIESIEDQAEYIMDKVDDKFFSMLFQTEIERVKYLLKGYLRTRLYKIEKYSLYVLRQPNLKELLSSQEISYARRYQELIESHNHDSFLHQMPLSQHRQDETSGDMNMVVEPNYEAPLFSQALVTVGHIEIKRPESDQNVLYEKDDIFLLRYRDIRQLLLEKKVKLV